MHEVQVQPVVGELRTELGMQIHVKQGRENGVALDEEELLFIAGGQDNDVDEDVDEQPVQDLALNMDNVFQADDSDVFDSDDIVCEHHKVHEMHDDVQPNYVIDSHADYTSDSNMIPSGLALYRQMASADNTSGPAPQRKESSGFVQNSVSPTPYVPPSKTDYEILFQPLFDEYFNPTPRAVSPVLAAVAASRAVGPAGSPSSTTIDQDVPSASTSLII
uniref:Retrovirus-related Pol polyprotein from transposon TNT 1-94 n=1 Tax=Tanacetum cinerariifolium TaxID=118510 RepID=A0A6L2NB53_TANCI|nr:retrovirus-related Pol polyprotein from transposon TNT 1-94 [Tanacetum cinerariifolium]